MVFYVDDSADIYTDGTFFGTHAGASTIHTLTIPDDVGLIAIKATNGGGPKGLQFYLEDGRFSSGEVKCTSTEYSGTLHSNKIIIFLVNSFLCRLDS